MSGSWPLEELWRRDQGICGVCHKSVPYPVKQAKLRHSHDSKHATRDHIIPRAKGGSNRRDNLRLVHYCCNQDIRDNTPGENHREAVVKLLQAELPVDHPYRDLDFQKLSNIVAANSLRDRMKSVRLAA